MRCDVRKMIKRIRAAGLIVENPRGKSGHFRVLRPNGSLVCTMPASPSDVRSDKNLVSRIRRHSGVRV